MAYANGCASDVRFVPLADASDEAGRRGTADACVQTLVSGRRWLHKQIVRQMVLGAFCVIEVLLRG